jgi:hypothetical protein
MRLKINEKIRNLIKIDKCFITMKKTKEIILNIILDFKIYIECFKYCLHIYLLVHSYTSLYICLQIYIHV